MERCVALRCCVKTVLSLGAEKSFAMRLCIVVSAVPCFVCLSSTCSRKWCARDHGWMIPTVWSLLECKNAALGFLCADPLLCYCKVGVYLFWNAKIQHLASYVQILFAVGVTEKHVMQNKAGQEQLPHSMS